MANWRVDINLSFEIDSDEIDAWDFFQANRAEIGSKADLLTERIFLDNFIGRSRVDRLLQFDLLRRASGVNSEWVVNGSTVKSGTDGEFTGTDEFRSTAVTLAVADEGRILRIPGGQGAGKNVARGHYKILTRNGPNSVTIDGVVPTTVTGLEFEINAPTQEFLATLLNTA